MMNQIFASFKYAIAIAIILLTSRLVAANSTEYVFSAPSEIGSELEEIPTQETDYPFYECNQEIVEETTSETAIDSHSCDCIDCEETTETTKEDSSQDGEVSSQNQTKNN